MGSSFKFKGIGNEPRADGRGTGTPPMADFFPVESTMGFDMVENFGSMNMDEMLKSIWSTEEAQNVGAATGGGQEIENRGQPGQLQGQGSSTLRRTPSQKTADEVWRDISREFDGGGAAGVLSQRRQSNLCEVSLEEFLIRAGAR